MKVLTDFGIPVVAVLIAGFLVWATTQVCKRAIQRGKVKYLFISALGSMVVACLVVATMGEWSWLNYTWTAYAGWLAANMLHKFFHKKMKWMLGKNV